jgi:FkbM family methyltransferase
MALSVLERILAWVHAWRAVSRDRRNAKHEPETVFLSALLAKDDICLHVGASEGRHSFVMAKCAPDGRIYAFEPNSYSFAALGHLLRMHGLTRIETMQAAVSDQPGPVTLNVPIKTTGRAGRSFGFIGAGVGRSEIVALGVKSETIPAITIDGFVSDQGLARVDFIRMDIEGAEALALKGAATTLEAFEPNLLLEIHPISLRENFGARAEQVVEDLLSRGYRMFGLDALGAVVETRVYATGAPWKDYFFVHPFRASRLPEGIFRQLMAN